MFIAQMKWKCVKFLTYFMYILHFFSDLYIVRSSVVYSYLLSYLEHFAFHRKNQMNKMIIMYLSPVFTDTQFFKVLNCTVYKGATYL